MARRPARAFLIASSILLLCLPGATLATFLLLPLWSWVKATVGVEAVGPSGPADWCFLVVYCVLAIAALTILRRRLRASGAMEDSQGFHARSGPGDARGRAIAMERDQPE